MKQFRLLFTLSTLIFFGLSPLSVVKAQTDPDSKDLVATIDSIFSDKADLSSPGASIIILKGNDILLSKSYGSANLAFGLPFDENTRFPLSNFTDQLVAFSIFQLEAKGLIQRTDPINKYLPELGFQNDVHIKHLLNHSSGLPMLTSVRLMAGWKFTDPFYQDDFLNLTKKFTTDLKPDTSIGHNHTGIKILQLLIEKATGIGFAEYVSTNIFQPLGMTNSGIKGDNFAENKNDLIGYTQTDNGFQKTAPTALALMCPMAYTTRTDFEKWMLNFHTKAFAGNIIEQMDQALSLQGIPQERANRAYCIGQQQYYRFLEEDEFYLMDTGEGYSWKWIRMQQSDVSIMAIGNLDTYIGNKVNDITRLMVSPPNTDSPTTEAPSAPEIQLSEKELQAYTGFYWDTGFLFTTEISIRDGKLFYHDLDNGWNFPLNPLSKTLFEAPPWNKVEFSNLDGQKKLKLILRDGREFVSEAYDPETISRKDFSRFTGIYTSDQLNTIYELVIENDQLLLKRNRKPDLELLPIGENKFRTREIDFRLIEFVADGEQRIYQMNFSNTAVKNIGFRTYH